MAYFKITDFPLRKRMHRSVVRGAHLGGWGSDLEHPDGAARLDQPRDGFSCPGCYRRLINSFRTGLSR